MIERVVLISGGTSGIGLAAARYFLQAGDRVVLMGRSAERGEQAMAALSAGQQVSFLGGDVSRRQDCEQVLAGTLSAFGRLDVLVNSAGIYREGAIEDMTVEHLDE